MSSYYDEEFKPWETVDGRCVVADEAEWGKLVEWNRKASEDQHVADQVMGTFTRPIVKVPTDIFYGDLHDVENGHGGLISWCDNECPTGEWNDCFCPECGAEGLILTTDDLLNRFFQTIDSTQHVDYLLMTQRPELVREKWPTRWVRSEHEYQDDPLDNIILATYVETQADIERLVPELIKCHDLCKGLAVVCNPKEELDFNFKPLLGKPEGYTNFAIEYLNLIIAEGNEHPIHPDHVRSLRDQCLDAGVPFGFASWGQWIPSDAPRQNGFQVILRPDGGVVDRPSWNQMLNTTGDDWIMSRIGKESDGCLLDGQEHNGRIA